jgi:hypothetical protein
VVAVVAKPVMFQALPDYGERLSLSDFLADVQSASLIDYDGHGALATANERSNVEVRPSTIHQVLYRHPEYLKWATHVVWFNK